MTPLTPEQIALASVCVQAAADAYTVTPTVQTDLAHVLIRYLPDMTVVAFRGTASITDFVTDLDFTLTDLGDGVWVHKGFHDALQSVIAAIPTDMAKPIVATGHSLGGAIAAMFAYENGKAISQVITFGEPRGGNEAYARGCNSCGVPMLRFVGINDIVPTVPPAPFYWHHDNEVLLKRELGGYIVNPDQWQILETGGLVKDISDHHVALYQARIQGIVRPPVKPTP